MNPSLGSLLGILVEDFSNIYPFLPFLWAPNFFSLKVHMVQWTLTSPLPLKIKATFVSH